MFLIGLDIGTTGCKAALFDDQGVLRASASREYSVDFPHPGWAEQDGEQVWSLARAALADCYQKLGQRAPVAALGLSVQGEAVAPVDHSGKPLRPFILGMDTRTEPQNHWLRQRFGAQALFQRTGMPVHTINTLPKLLWLKQEQPEIWSAAARFLLYEDFIIACLCGAPAISHCLASRTQLYDLRLGGWSAEILAALELDPERLAPIVPSGTVVGELRAELAAELGFPNRPLVVTGGHDQACGALGAGLTRPGLSMVSTGTAEVVEVALGCSLAAGAPQLSDELEAGNISVYAHVLPGLYLAMTLNHSGGLILRWFRDTFCQEEVTRARQTGADPYDLIFRDAGSAPSPVLLLPHFSGSGTPHFDTQSKGAMLGLTFATTRSDVARAILEGLCFELRYNLEVLQSGGVTIQELRAIGGGARSPLWLRLKADITGLPVAQPQVTEAAAWGAASLAGQGAGIFASAADAVQERLQFAQRILPQPAQQALYQPRYDLYRRLYPALADLLHQM